MSPVIQAMRRSISQTTAVGAQREHACCCTSLTVTLCGQMAKLRGQAALTLAMITWPLASAAFFFAFLLSMPAFAFSLCRFFCASVTADGTLINLLIFLVLAIAAQMAANSSGRCCGRVLDKHPGRLAVRVYKSVLLTSTQRVCTLFAPRRPVLEQSRPAGVTAFGHSMTRGRGRGTRESSG